MQRRLQLAAVLVNEVQLLFVEEPTANLDPILRRKFWEEFKNLRDSGRTIFTTTQYVSEAEECDRVGLISSGELVAVGSPQQSRREAFGGEMIVLEVLNGADVRSADELNPSFDEVFFRLVSSEAGSS